MRYLLTVIVIMFGSMVHALELQHISGDHESGTMLVTNIDKYDATVYIPTQSCPADISKFAGIESCYPGMIRFVQTWLLVDYEMKNNGTSYRIREHFSGEKFSSSPMDDFLADGHTLRTKNSLRQKMKKAMWNMMMNPDDIPSQIHGALILLDNEFDYPEGFIYVGYFDNYIKTDGLWYETDEEPFLGIDLDEENLSAGELENIESCVEWLEDIFPNGPGSTGQGFSNDGEFSVFIPGIGVITMFFNQNEEWVVKTL